MGLGFGDRFGGFQGRSGPLEEMVPHAKKAGELQGWTGLITAGLISYPVTSFRW